MTTKPIKEPKYETLRLLKRIEEMKPADEISYEELSQLIGVNDIRHSSRHFLDSARKMALHRSNIVTDCIHGKGIRRLTDEQTAFSGAADTRKARRHARRITIKQLTVEVEKLSHDARTFYESALRVAEVMRMVTSPKKMKKVGEKSIASNGNMTPGKLMELFK